MCNIGLDILADVPGQSGQVNIHRNTLIWLPRLAPDWTFTVFATPYLKSYYESRGVTAPNLRWVNCWADNRQGALLRLLTQELQLVWLARRAALDCFIAYPLPFLFQYLQTPTVYRHTLPPNAVQSHFGDRYRRAKIRFSASRARAVLCNSEYALANLETFIGHPLKRSVVIWEAFDSSIFGAHSLPNPGRVRSDIRAAMAASRLRVLVPAGLQPRKNTGLVLAMLDWLQSAGCALPQVIFVGNNEPAYAAHLRTQYADFFDSGTAMALGFCSHDEVAFLGQHAALAIYPSKIETFGVPPLEMMASGVPVLVANAGPMPEISGPGAELFDPDDAPALARKVQALLADADARGELRARGAEFVRRYSWERNARESLELLRAIIDSSHNGLNA